MARRKTSAAQDFMDLIALLPWWVGVTLAVLSYFGLHHVASQAMAVPTQSNHAGALFTHTIWRTFASIGQVAVPVLCICGAGMSAWRRLERKQLLDNVVRSDAADALDGMSWQQFERLVGEGFRLQGYRVVETGGGGPDGGVDLLLRRDGEKYLVQCKQWRAFRVGVDVVRELYGVMAARGAAGGFLVTSGRFTEEAQSFANGRNVQLIDGAGLSVLLKQVSASRAEATSALEGAASFGATAATVPPLCPACAKLMIRRIARRGANAGTVFWGCTGYPACRGTRSIS
jgi:restriction system protein